MHTEICAQYTYSMAIEK